MAAAEGMAELMGIVDELEMDNLRVLGEKLERLEQKLDFLADAVAEIRALVGKR
jgi:hypothetical protein